MLSHAALAAASGGVSFEAADPPVDLGWESPGRPEPVIADDEMEGSAAPLPDLSASSAPLVRDALPPASSSTPEQDAFRKDIPRRRRRRRDAFRKDAFRRLPPTSSSDVVAPQTQRARHSVPARPPVQSGPMRPSCGASCPR